jgi:hypothetical protein
MNEQEDPKWVNDAEDPALGDYISTLTTLFVPTLEEEEWAWWPSDHDFRKEWEQGALWEIALDSAFGSPLNDLRPEVLEEAIAIGEAVADELYGSSDEWVIPLAFGLVGLKLHLLGPEFQAAVRAWYEQLLVRAKAHYLHADQVVP